MQRTEAAFPRHAMEQNSHSMRRASVTQRWLDIRSDSVLICSCIWLASQLFATRLRWSRVRDQAACNLQKHFSACATATPALTSSVSGLEIACMRGAAQVYFRGSSRGARGIRGACNLQMHETPVQAAHACTLRPRRASMIRMQRRAASVVTC